MLSERSPRDDEDREEERNRNEGNLKINNKLNNSSAVQHSNPDIPRKIVLFFMLSKIHHHRGLVLSEVYLIDLSTTAAMALTTFVDDVLNVQVLGTEAVPWFGFELSQRFVVSPDIQ